MNTNRRRSGSKGTRHGRKPSGRMKDYRFYHNPLSNKDLAYSKKMFSDVTGLTLDKCTCFRCDRNRVCFWSYDSYNTDEDCMNSK